VLGIPLVETVAWPFVVTLVLYTAFHRWRAGREQGLAGAAVVLGFLLATVLVLGAPELLPRLSYRKLFPIALLGLLVGAAADYGRARLHRAVPAVVAVLWPGLIALWIGWPRLAAGDHLDIYRVIGLWAGGALALGRLERVRDEAERSLAPAAMLLAASLGLGALGLYFGTATTGRLGFGLAAPLAAILLWNWVAVMRDAHGGDVVGQSVLLGAGGVVVALAAILLFYTSTTFLVLLFLVPVFFSYRVFGAGPRGEGVIVRTLHPLVLFLASMVPVLMIAAVLYLFAMVTRA